jgi:hypothetical protein
MKTTSRVNISIQFLSLWLILSSGVMLSDGWARGSKPRELNSHPELKQPATLSATPGVGSASGLSVASSGGLSSAEGKSLLKKLTAMQSEELKALERTYQADAKRLKASQKERLMMWESAEKEARHLYFKDHPNGPERRTYIQEFLKRREQLVHDLSAEKDQLKKSFEQKVLDLKKAHAEHLTRARSFVDSGAQPPEELWPQTH